jgi:hypothetical protein
MSKPILCLDFDGVVHKYDSPWSNAETISDDVTDGFFEWAERAKGGMHTIEAPLSFEFASEKPAAFLTIDDRAIRFEGNWSHLDPETLIHFKPWNKRARESTHGT